MQKNTGHKKGFSLIELMVASALFLTVVAVAAGAFISVLDASIQSREMNALMSTLDFALEDISRNLRVGENYIVDGDGRGMMFLVYAEDSADIKCTIRYRLTNSAILKTKAGDDDVLCPPYSDTPITSSEIQIDRLSFVLDQEGINTQPRVIINLRGVISGEVEQDFVLQTSVTQRALNL